jgi:hypothetical protein
MCPRMGCPAYIPRRGIRFPSGTSGTIKPGYNQIRYKPALMKRLQTSGPEFFYSRYSPSISIVPGYRLRFRAFRHVLISGFCYPSGYPLAS